MYFMNFDNCYPNVKVEELSSSSIDIKQNALTHLTDILHDPYNISDGITSGLLGILRELVNDSEVTTRQKTTKLLMILAGTFDIGQAKGRDALIENHIFEVLPPLVNDPDESVRMNVHRVYAAISMVAEVIPSILSQNSAIVQSLLIRLSSTKDPEPFFTQHLILTTLYNLTLSSELCAETAIALQAIPILTNLLISKIGGTDVMVGAANVLQALSFGREGKKQIVKYDDDGKGDSSMTIKVLVEVLKHTSSEVRAAAAGALMSIAVDVEAKGLIIQENAVPLLSNLLKDPNDAVQLNALKTISAIAEDSRARFALQGSLDVVCCF
ncbi:armadillo-type protein [Paraphysoderma sedebokerense]|nr:armadillo-type protein [Paraphysoderma sedebokerense]